MSLFPFFGIYNFIGLFDFIVEAGEGDEDALEAAPGEHVVGLPDKAVLRIAEQEEQVVGQEYLFLIEVGLPEDGAVFRADEIGRVGDV